MYLTIFGLLTVCFLCHIGKETYIFIPQPHFLGRLHMLHLDAGKYTARRK
jgi:hypothetical protein